MAIDTLKPELLTSSSFFELFSLKGAYHIAYGFLFGMSFWVTFFGGFIALKALPRHQFGNLQHKTFPIYFNLSIFLSAGLLALWSYGHPTVLDHYTEPKIVDVAQAYTLLTVVVNQGLNNFVVGPLTSKTMFKRHKLEKEEGKSWTDQDISPAMKELNRTFAKLHGISSLFNLSAILAIIFHGLWIANKGTGL